MKLLLAFLAFCALFYVASSATAPNPTQALVQEQVWELSHIIGWLIVGSFFSTLIFLCAIIFACCNYFCVARRQETASIAQDENYNPLNRKRRNVSLALIVVFLLLVIFLGTVLVFNSFILSFVYPSSLPVANLAQELSTGTLTQGNCQLMQNFTEAYAISKECNKISHTLSDSNQIVQEVMAQFQDSVWRLVLIVNILSAPLLLMILVAAIGACRQSSLPIRIFTVLSLFFAGMFCLLWMIYAMPSTLFIHNCEMVQTSFWTNNSESFPGIQIIAYVYNQTNEFRDFHSFEHKLRENQIDLDQVNFTQLLPQQEELFSMIRTCLWDGQTLDSLLNVVQLKEPLNAMLSLSKEVVERMDHNLKGSSVSLPPSINSTLYEISWSSHSDILDTILVMAQNTETLQGFDFQLREHKNSFHSSVYHNLTQDSLLLSSQLTGISNFASLSDCQPFKEAYRTVHEEFCNGMLNVSNTNSWLLMLLCLLTVLSFFIAFYAGHRVFSRPAGRREQQTPLLSKNNVQSADASAPLLSSDKQYYAAGPVSYNPVPPPYNSAYEKL